MKPKIKKITVEVTCNDTTCVHCEKPFEVTTSKIKEGYRSCDCDYPCGCPTGEYLYIKYECPVCGRKSREIIWNESR